MNLNIDKWKYFKVCNIFKLKNGKGITKEEIEDNKGTFTVVQSGEENNGVIGKIDLEYCRQMNYTFSTKPCLTVARTGSAGFVSFQYNGCVVGDSAKILLLDDNVATTEHYLFLQAILNANRFKYTYGRKVTEDKYMNDYIKLPIQYNTDGTIFIDNDKKYSDEGYIPDWEFMENYIKSLHYKPMTTNNKSGRAIDFKIENWKEFELNRLFEISAGNYYSVDEYEEGDTPYISASATNNAISQRINLSADFKGNVLITGKIGSVCFYQVEDFCATSDVNIFQPKKFTLNPHLGLFLATIINFSENYKWSYGRQCRVGDSKKIIIKLPIQVDDKGKFVIDDKKDFSDEGYIPDWEFMENYMKSLPYGDKI